MPKDTAIEEMVVPLGTIKKLTLQRQCNLPKTLANRYAVTI
jgi:hypothetical protein